MSDDNLCKHCGGKSSVRNPTGTCDHLCWPDGLTDEARLANGFVPEPAMRLHEALRILADIHTKDDDQTGFVFLVGANAGDYRTSWSQAEHLEAWSVVRKHLHMQTEPQSKR